MLQSNNNGGYDAYIVEYEFTKEEYSALNEAFLSSTTTKYSPINFDTSVFNTGELSKVPELLCVETWTLEYHSTPRDWSITPVWVSSITCGFVDGGGGSSSGDSPTSPGNDGGMTSGGGSGGGANNDNDDPNELELPENPCKENCIEIVTVPVVDEVLQATCQKMTDLKNDDVFKQKMVILKTAVEQWSFEKAFTVYDDPTPNTAINQSDNFDYDEFQGSASNPYIDWVGNSTIKGYIHSHFNGLLSIFSAHDLVDMYKTLLTPTVTDEFFYGVVTQSGTAYILQIDDRSSFIAFGNNYLSTTAKINVFLSDQIKSEYEISENNTNAVNELGFVRMLDELNAGLNIYKATDLTFIEYQKLEIVNNEVISNPCN